MNIVQCYNLLLNKVVVTFNTYWQYIYVRVQPTYTSLLFQSKKITKTT